MYRNMGKKWLKSRSRPVGPQPRKRADGSTYRPRVEALEDRMLLAATITVNSAAAFDSTGTMLTLLQAIEVNNGTLPLASLSPAQLAQVSGDPTGGGNTIAFNIGGGGKQTISVADVAQMITVKATVDGSTQPGFAGTPLIELLPSATDAYYGIDIETEGCTVKDLAFGSFSRAGINLGSNGNLVEGNYIGTDLSGKLALPNTDGVRIVAGSNNTIGGLTDAQRNVISGNVVDGVKIDGSTGPAKMNIVEHNYIGTDVSGAAPLGNGNGVEILVNAALNTIGGVAGDATRNIISGNAAGVSCTAGGGAGNVVVGNYIGTDKDGKTKVGNVVGVAISGVGYTIGGTAVGMRNIISGNTNGIQIGGTGANLVQGNYIGTDQGGTAALGNTTGVLIFSSTGSMIGGTAAGAGNTISGNETGVVLAMFSTANVLQGNLIGTDHTGAAALPNTTGGVVIAANSNHNGIGGAVPGSGNRIAGNAKFGVLISDPQTSFNAIAGNTIGGAGPLANGGDGVALMGGCTDNLVGGTAAGQSNVIEGNTGAGVHLGGAGTQRNLVQGNSIGTNAAGAVAVANGVGVVIDSGATNNTLGGAVAGGGNTISGNTSGGVFLMGGATQNNLVTGNSIGTNAVGDGPLGNGGDGVAISGGADNNTIGGTAHGAGNTTSGNKGNGISIAGAGMVMGNLVQGNFIGTKADGTGKIGNTKDGVLINAGAAANRLGTADQGGGNTISGNGTNGVEISGAGTMANAVQHNFIGTNAAGAGGMGNGNDGVLLTGGAASNTIGGAIVGAGNIISGNGSGNVNGDNGIEIAAANMNTVQNNYIGTDPTGNASLLNLGDGVLITAGAANNVIGGRGVGGADGQLVNMLSNLISGNGLNGVVITGVGTNANTLSQDVIGTDVEGAKALGNGFFGDGVLITAGAANNTIGAPGAAAPGFANLISGNQDRGIAIIGPGTTGNLLRDNLIGTNAAGRAPLANSGNGVLIQNAPRNTVGDPVAGSNVISGNGGNGVKIFDNAGPPPITVGNLVQSNFIGTDLVGLNSLPNLLDGILIDGAPGNTVGVPTAPPNIISGNGANGVEITGRAAAGNLVQTNYIGTNVTGRAAIPNTADGVLIDGAPTNTIGVAAPGPANFISGNGANGVEIRGAAAAVNTIGRNGIGINSFAAPLGNTGSGILIDGAGGSNIGAPLGPNTIAFNGASGAVPPTGGVVIIDDPTLPAGNATGNTILGGNSIFGNIGLGIDLGDDGVTVNESVGHVGPNHFQNYPVFTAFSDGMTTTVTGILQSLPVHTYRIEFFKNATKDPSGFGQGQTPLGFIGPIVTDSNGHYLFNDVAIGPDFTGSFITATATDITGGTPQLGDTSEFSGAAPVGVPGADLTLTNAAPASVPEGANFTYTITVHNNGPSDAGNVVVTDVLPPNVHLVSANFGAVTATVSGNTVMVSLGTLLNGATVQGTIVVQVPEEGRLASMASVSSSTFDPNLSNNSQTANTTVTDPAVVPTPGNVSATAGAPFSGPVASFTDPGGSEVNAGDPAVVLNGHYKVVSINWGDGTPLDTKTGTLSYTGSLGSATASFIATATHTYATAGSYTITITFGHEGVLSTVTTSAVIANLGLSIDPRLTQPLSFWGEVLGQELLRRFGLTASGQTLGQWLATTFPNLYGGGNGASNLSNLTNAQIAIYYLGLFNNNSGPKLDAAVLATVLDVFATTQSLGGTVGASYGFLVNVFGLGAYSINIGSSGAAFGVPNNSVLNVYQILLATNNSAMGGEPEGTNLMLRNELLAVFERIDGPI